MGHEQSLNFARHLVEVSHAHELPPADEANVLVGYAVGVLLAHGRTADDVRAFCALAVDRSLAEAQIGGLIAARASQ